MKLLHIAFLFVLYGRTQCQDQTYLVTGPRLWRVGAQETVVVQTFGRQEKLAVRISLLSFPDKTTKYASQHLELTSANNFQGLVSLQIQPEDFPRKAGTPQSVYLQAQSDSFTREEKVPVTYQNGFLFIQTDKPVYTPDQSVKIRVYSMDEELRPARRPVTLTFKDPEEVKMDSISQKDITGIISFPDFKIPANPKFGIWKVEAAYETDFITSTAAKFEVKEYVLPRFFVTIEPEKNFISFDKFKDFAITVKANYYYAKKVDYGKVFIRYGLIEHGVRRMMPKSIDLLQIINGEATFQFNSQRAVEELGYSQLEELDGFYLYITVTVEETSGAQSEESEYSNVKYVITPYTLKLIATPLFVKPTLPYRIKVQLKDTLDNPVQRIPLTISGEMIKEGGEASPLGDSRLKSQATDNKGTVSFVINMPADIRTLEFKITTEDVNLPEENQASARYTATSYKSLTNSYLYINWARESQVLHVDDFLNVQVVPSSPYLAKLTHYSYLLISKGKILKFDTIKRFPESVSQNLNIAITSSMIPSFRLLVYYIITGETTAEVIADSIWVDVEEKCVNNQKVQLSTTETTFKPKAEVPLIVNARTGSIIALSAMDVAVYDVTRKVRRPLERVLRKIEESDLGCGAGAGQDNVDVFRLAGLTFITNANIEASRDTDMTCTDIVRSKRSSGDEIFREANKYRDKRLKQCCLDGSANFLDENDCNRGVARTKKLRADGCVKAFDSCCKLAKRIKEKADEEQKDLWMGRIYIRTVFDIDEPEIRSYFPESWFWEEHAISRADFLRLSTKLPDSLTTWEIQGISMSDKGICVAEPLKITVYKDLFLDVQLPYSVVRGEQVQIQVTVYNYLNYNVKGCVSVSVGKQLCMVHTDFASSHSSRLKGCNEDFYKLKPKTISYNLLPLELGFHPITFKLTIINSLNSGEVVVKSLRVVPEGIQEERSVGFTLDPQGLRGLTRRRHELSFKVPANIVPKSKISRILSINGNILGEVIDTVLNEESVKYLVSIPKGSAESELMRVAPLFYVYHFLEKKKEWSLLGSNIFMSQFNMKKKLKESVSSLLSFRNKDHSYSLWRDADPSTWLTAFAMRIFGDVSNYVTIDHMSACNSLLWLIENCQTKQGSFEEKSATQPVRLQGFLPKEAAEKALYLTAYVVIGIQKSSHMCRLTQVDDALNLAIEYLSKHVTNAQSTFSLAITAYALATSEATGESKGFTIQKLKNEAFIKGIGEPPVYRYWKDTLKIFDATAPSAETAKMVETTAYALLAFLKNAERDYAQPVIRWLKEQQRYGGGFYSTQDTITALEALTEVAILDEKLILNMDVKVSYRKAGDFKSYRLTDKNPFTRPVEVPIQEDLIIDTRSTTGIATGNVKTVYNIISPPQENCKYDLKIQKKANPFDDEKSIYDDESTDVLRLEACARYKPSENELPDSGQAVMEITLITGLQADEKQLNKLMNRVDQYVTDYSIEDGKVILHFEWISSDEYICATVLLRKLFKVAMTSPGIFKVYELHSPDQQCTIFYNPFADENLVQVCTGDACRCIAGECPNVKSKVDETISADQRKNVVCKGDVTYAYKVQIVKSEEDGDFVKYTATILDIFHIGTASLRARKNVRFIKKKTCTDFIMETGEQYLVMGKEGTLIRDDREIQYEYALESSSWVEWWPKATSCSTCPRFIALLTDFSESILLEGCR
ncbi:complement C5 [Mixophyes fleayi]|uniref:complement C5 n=1 Tax=Mixophyes fleayi TaxID=3061075 RepID=UPI003F4DC969